jgi:hypothetical protein
MKASKEDRQKVIDTLKELYGIHAIWFWGIRDLVRVQFDRNHLEFVEFDELVEKLRAHFESEFMRRDGAIKDLENLPYLHLNMSRDSSVIRIKSFVELSVVIDLLNSRRKDHRNYKKNIKILKQLHEDSHKEDTQGA